MADFFAPKDVESLNKLAVLMVVPFLGAALFIDLGLWVHYFDGMHWLLDAFNSSSSFVRFISKALSFSLSIVIVFFAYESINRFAVFPYPRVCMIVGMSLLAFGVLGIGHLVQPNEIGSFNIFWHLGALCWGLHIFAPLPKSEGH